MSDVDVPEIAPGRPRLDFGEPLGASRYVFVDGQFRQRDGFLSIGWPTAFRNRPVGLPVPNQLPETTGGVNGRLAAFIIAMALSAVR